MIIDWTQAPIGTTHATINGGEPRWYQETLGGMNCWNVATATWFQSFFSSPSDIEDNGLRLYALGEQTELVMLREQRDALLSAVNMYEAAFEGLFSVCLSNGVYNQWGRAVDCTSLNEAHRLGELAIKKCAAVS